jgi:uncharacterized RDD family membrane protein YckC
VNAFAQPSAAPIAGPQLDNRRVLAAVIDLLVILAGGFVLGLATGVLAGGDAKFGPGMQAVAVAWALYYYFALESGAGQTLGKKVMKLRVLRADGAPVGLREVAIRTVLRVVDGLFLYLVGLVVMLATGERRQRLGDLAAGTVVADASATPPPEAAAAAPAGPAPEALDRQDESDPFEHTPVDVGAPLEGLTAPEAPDVPELREFDPFATPAEQEEETHADASFPEEPEVEVQYAQDAGAEEPEVDMQYAQPSDEPRAEHSPTEWPHMYAARAHAAEAAPQAEEEQFAPASEDEPAAPEAEQVAPPADEGYSRPDELQGPDLSAAPVEDSESAEPVEDLRADAARSAHQPVEAESEVPGLPGSPVEEPVAGEAPAPDAEASSDDSDEQGEHVTVRSVETVSAIDLVMGGAEGEGTDSNDADSGDEPAPGDEPSTGDDPSTGDEHQPGA